MPGSGIFGTFAYGAASAWGVYSVPNHFLTAQSEGFQFEKTIAQEHVLYGQLYDRADRRAWVKKGATGSFDLALYDRGLGLLFQNMLGNVVTSGAGPYTQTFFQGDTTGLSMTVQIGRPMTSNASVQAFSYEGVKVKDWTFDVKTGEFATFNVTFDAMQEDTTQTYAAASYVASDILSAVNATLIIGGSVTTSASVASLSGGASVSLAKEVQIKGTNAIDDERYYFGSITKQEQLVNGFRALTGTAVITFNDLTTVYNAMAADTPVALSLSVQSANYISGSTYGAVNILIPRLYWDKDAINLKGPQLIDQDITFTALYDNVNTPIQIQYVTLDSAP